MSQKNLIKESIMSVQETIKEYCSDWTDADIDILVNFLNGLKKVNLNSIVAMNIADTKWDKSTPYRLESRFEGSELQSDIRYDYGGIALDNLDWKWIYQNLRQRINPYTEHLIPFVSQWVLDGGFMTAHQSPETLLHYYQEEQFDLCVELDHKFGQDQASKIDWLYLLNHASAIEFREDFD